MPALSMQILLFIEKYAYVSDCLKLADFHIKVKIIQYTTKFYWQLNILWKLSSRRYELFIFYIGGNVHAHTTPSVTQGHSIDKSSCLK